MSSQEKERLGALNVWRDIFFFLSSVVATPCHEAEAGTVEQ